MITSAAQITRPDTSRPETRWLSFRGDGGTLLGMMFVNAVLTVCTFGVYYFWAKSKVRSYLWNSFELDGERFQFHGTGKELFFAWIRVIGIFLGAVLMVGIVAGIFGKDSPVTMLVSGLLNIGIFLITPVAIIVARRYLLTRTSWRGIYFSFRGDVMQFARLFFGGAILSVLTLGFYLPYFISSVYGYLVNNSYYGTRPFHYDGKGSDLVRLYVKSFFLGLVTFGIYWFWFAAALNRYLRDHTTWGGIRFASTMTGGGLLQLAFTNVLLVVFTLGLAAPWVLVRNLRYQCRTTALRGTLDLSEVGQSHDRGSAMGEELAAVLDVGGLGV